MGTRYLPMKDTAKLTKGFQEACNRAVYRQGRCSSSIMRSAVRVVDSLLETLRGFGEPLRPHSRIEPKDKGEPLPVYYQATWHSSGLLASMDCIPAG